MIRVRSVRLEIAKVYPPLADPSIVPGHARVSGFDDPISLFHGRAFQVACATPRALAWALPFGQTSSGASPLWPLFPPPLWLFWPGQHSWLGRQRVRLRVLLVL